MARDNAGDDYRKHANLSGFPLQIGLRHHIDAGTRKHGWRVLAEEHGWRDPESGRSGFVDLVLGHSDLHYHPVLECKRVKDPGAAWIFLCPRSAGSPAAADNRSTVFLTAMRENRRMVCGWTNLGVGPVSPVSGYCVIRGQDEPGRPMLERVTDGLLPSAEAVGRELIDIKRPWFGGLSFLFVPMIVTTARLVACRFDAGSIGLEDGEIPDAGCETEDVPFLRFRKALTTRHRPTVEPGDLEAANSLKRQSVLVVQAKSLMDTLGSMNSSYFGGLELANAIDHLAAQAEGLAEARKGGRDPG